MSCELCEAAAVNKSRCRRHQLKNTILKPSKSSQKTTRRQYEHMLHDMLKKEGIEPDWHDACIPSSKLRYRPDFLYILQSKALIIEVDENGHENYDQEKEVSRMECIAKEFRGTLVLLRIFVPCSESDMEKFVEIVEKELEGCVMHDACTKNKIKRFEYSNGVFLK